MSADNFIGVVSLGDGEGWIVCEGSMSILCEQHDSYMRTLRERGGPVYGDRASALVAAHDRERAEEYPVEYGVIEL